MIRGLRYIRIQSLKTFLRNAITVLMFLSILGVLYTVDRKTLVDIFVRDIYQTPDLAKKLVLDGPPGCPCKRSSPNNKKTKVKSLCSNYATARGTNQTVFSYSYYRPRFINNKHKIEEHIKKYLKLLEEKLKVIEKNYPGWLVRLYHNVTIKEEKENDFLCQMYCKYSHLDLCDVSKLPLIGDLSQKQPIGRMWRFSVMGDPTISTFLIRDTDSSILDREMSAVKEWFQSRKRFHMMRDYPKHMATILAGLWGAKNGPDLEPLRDAILSSPPEYYTKYDQYLLDKFLWPIMERDLLQHVSYTCERTEFGKMIPFPTQREDGYYVGWGPFKIKERIFVKNTLCPLKCRPVLHPDWEFC